MIQASSSFKFILHQSQALLYNKIVFVFHPNPTSFYYFSIISFYSSLLLNFFLLWFVSSFFLLHHSSSTTLHCLHHKWSTLIFYGLDIKPYNFLPSSPFPFHSFPVLLFSFLITNVIFLFLLTPTMFVSISVRFVRVRALCTQSFVCIKLREFGECVCIGKIGTLFKSYF